MSTKWIKALLLIGLIALSVMAGFFFQTEFTHMNLQAKIAAYGWYAPVIFVGIYVTATVLMLPGSALTLTGGLLFGPWFGTCYSLTAAVIGASIAFLIARYLASDWVADKARGHLKRLLDGVEREGWRFVAVVRLIPLIPFNLLNYALGLTRIHVLPYAIASFVFMLPGAFAYSYVGSLGQHAIAGDTKKFVTQGLIAVGLVVLVMSLPWLVRQWRGRNGAQNEKS